MRKTIIACCASLLLPCSIAMANHPPLMGWSSWNTYGFQINDSVIKVQADAMVNLGFQEKGYNHINIDDGFFGGRDSEGNLLIHPTRFPNGLRPLVDYIHSKGLKAGIYSDAGANTCASYWGNPKDTIGIGVGLYKHDAEDLNLYFNDLDFDFIKVDYCGADARNNADGLDLDVEKRYKEIAAAIKETGSTDATWNICRWAFPGTWACEIADSWRTTEDIYLGWESIKSIIGQSLYLSAYTSYGHYNDMDMLEVGRGLTEEEDKTHFGMWCMMSSPLLIGCDMNDIKGNALSLMQNEELIALNQNTLGQQAYVVQKSKDCYVLTKDMEEANGVEDMMYMVSSASNNGSASIQIYFRQGTDGDMAMVNVQNRMAQAQGLLPAEVTRSGVTVRKRQTSRIKMLAIYSPDNSFDQNFISNYAKINIEPRLSRIAGVGEVDIMGGDYSLRIWLDPGKMTKYNLMPSDIRKVLDEQNIESPTGTLGADSDNTFRYTLKYRGRYEKETDYENLVIRAQSDGTVLRLKDVARVELGSRSYEFVGTVNGHPGVSCMISQTSGSNANEIIEEIDKVVAEMQKDLPRGLQIVDLMSTKDFLDASIKNVIKTLFEAILLVILVVYIFLQNLRSTLIPAASIIVSLVGTFAFLLVAGFSLNLITLFALVLVIGTVVDDAIVVVEAVQAKFDEGYTSAYEATVSAMGGITTALLTTTFVFMAVFIPVSFMGGTTGTFYMQFGLTMAVAVGISLISALTLSPALCALIMTPHQVGEDGKKLSFSSRFHLAFDAVFGRLVKKYLGGVSFMFRHRWLSVLLIITACGGLFYMMQTTKTGLVRQEGSLYAQRLLEFLDSQKLFCLLGCCRRIPFGRYNFQILCLNSTKKYIF